MSRFLCAYVNRRMFVKSIILVESFRKRYHRYHHHHPQWYALCTWFMCICVHCCRHPYLLFLFNFFYIYFYWLTRHNSRWIVFMQTWTNGLRLFSTHFTAIHCINSWIYWIRFHARCFSSFIFRNNRRHVSVTQPTKMMALEMLSVYLFHVDVLLLFFVSQAQFWCKIFCFQLLIERLRWRLHWRLQTKKRITATTLYRYLHNIQFSGSLVIYGFIIKSRAYEHIAI